MRVTAHRGLVDGDDAAARIDERLQLGAHDREQGLGDRPAVGVVGVRLDAAREGVRAGNAGLQLRALGRDRAQALPLGDHAQPARRAELPDDPVSAALIVRGRAEPAAGLVVELEPVEEGVEGQVEVEARLFAVGDDVEAGPKLVADGRPDGVAGRLLAVVGPELGEMLAGELEPAREGIAADHRGADGLVRHGWSAYGDSIAEDLRDAAPVQLVG